MTTVARLRERLVAHVPPAPTEESFTSTLRGPAVTSRVGLWLGVCFAVAFVTGLISHEAHLAHPVLPLPTRPVWAYRFTQGLHVASGTAAIPLLLVKLWSVYPKLFARPPRPRRDLVLHGLERASIAVLVASAIFQLSTGLANAAQWYPWGFHFRATHYAIAWVAVGALLVHVAVKLPLIHDSLTSPIDAGAPAPDPVGGPPLTRRQLVGTAYGAAGLAVLATIGSTVPALRKVSVLGVRSGAGPGGIPINKSARAADVVAGALDADFRLVLTGPTGTASFSREDLLALPQHTATLPIACVEGWSASGSWSGPRIRDLVGAVGAPPTSDLRIVSLQQAGPYKETVLPASFATDPLTLLALTLDGEPLALDHGYPCRLIAPNRPGVLQTKWVARIEVLT
ncbi:molybdopterin-dependent oxidoreductase [Marmoricola sp. RAF53]|uniref:molybdopterin-dependent oxidoreductase n=1 Tax=Marmoricola sp. RAF53 TaxID=3233059 RepID=UPI003F9DF7DF